MSLSCFKGLKFVFLKKTAMFPKLSLSLSYMFLFWQLASASDAQFRQKEPSLPFVICKWRPLWNISILFSSQKQELCVLLSLFSSVHTETFISSKLYLISPIVMRQGNSDAMLSDLPCVEWELHRPPSEGEEEERYIQLFFFPPQSWFPTVACEVIYHRSFHFPSPISHCVDSFIPSSLQHAHIMLVSHTQTKNERLIRFYTIRSCLALLCFETSIKWRQDLKIKRGNVWHSS